MIKKITTIIAVLVVTLCTALLFSACNFRTFTVSFDSNGGTEVASVSVKDGESFSAPNIPEKNGYEFDGWYLDDESWDFEEKISADITLVAHWRPIIYTISYTDEFDAENPNPTTYDIESQVDIVGLEKEGYTFNGWFFSGSARRAERIPRGSTGAVYLTASWTPIEYDITYIDELNAENNNPNKYTIESEIIFERLSKDGYAFIGWFDADEQRVNKIDIGSTGALTLTAVWVADEFEIEYLNTFGADNPNPASYKTIEEDITLVDIVREDYTFLGWFDENEQRVEKIQTGSSGKITLTAGWTLTEYPITYVDELNAYNENPTSYTKESVFEIQNVYKSGYTFNGWFDKDNNKVDSIEAGSKGAITLTASWTVIEYVILYDNTLGADNPNPSYYTTEQEVTLVSLEKEGYTFNGWFDILDRKTETIAKGRTDGIWLYASWTPNEYSITYIDEFNAENDNPTVYTAESAFEISDLVFDGYDFLGWFDKDNNKVERVDVGSTGDMVLTAVWTESVYDIEYVNVCDAVNGNPISYKSSDQTIVLTTLEREGYDFIGWFDSEGVQVESIENGSSGDLTLRAKWSPLRYYVTFAEKSTVDNRNGTYSKLNYTLVGGASKDAFTVERGETITLPDAQVNAMYDCGFSYWFVYVDGEMVVITPETVFDYTTVGEDANIIIIPLLASRNTANF